MSSAPLSIQLSAVIVAVTGDQPRVLTVENGAALPAGPLESSHRTLELGLRAWVEASTRHPLGYVEQLYTFGDRDRTDRQGGRVISLSYLALTQEAAAWGEAGAAWSDWYVYFPWEDRRAGGARLVADQIAPRLVEWCAEAGDPAARRARSDRASTVFGLNGAAWKDEFTLQRFELLYEARLIPEAVREHPNGPERLLPIPGRTMAYDHRRMLATGISRLRAKIKYRPVFFELMPPSFTLLQLQHAVEALAGRRLHKQNFRRTIEQQGLVEPTGEVSAQTGGRPAKLMRFRRDVVHNRAVAGATLPLDR